MTQGFHHRGTLQKQVVGFCPSRGLSPEPCDGPITSQQRWAAASDTVRAASPVGRRESPCSLASREAVLERCECLYKKSTPRELASVPRDEEPCATMAEALLVIWQDRVLSPPRRRRPSSRRSEAFPGPPATASAESPE